MDGFGSTAALREINLDAVDLPVDRHVIQLTTGSGTTPRSIKCRTRVVRIFPKPASWLRPVRALCAETHEAWLEANNRYINMDLLKEHKKAMLAA